MIKAIFSDIDNTLIFADATHGSGVQRIGQESRYVANKVVELAKSIQTRLYLITGRRKRSFDGLSNIIPYTQAVIEHGGLILDQSGRFLANWIDVLRPAIGDPNAPCRTGVLWEYEQQLNREGFVTDSNGRFASFRVDPVQNSLTAAELACLENRNHPAGITTTRNLNFLDFLPEPAGKLNCIRFVCSQMGFSLSDVACIGDDYNDLEMLTACGHRFTHAGALPDIIRTVGEAGGYVSPLAGHNAAIDILQRLVALIDGNKDHKAAKDDMDNRAKCFPVLPECNLISPVRFYTGCGMILA